MVLSSQFAGLLRVSFAIQLKCVMTGTVNYELPHSYRSASIGSRFAAFHAG